MGRELVRLTFVTAVAIKSFDRKDPNLGDSHIKVKWLSFQARYRARIEVRYRPRAMTQIW
jgi:hypothetical protein